MAKTRKAETTKKSPRPLEDKKVFAAYRKVLDGDHFFPEDYVSMTKVVMALGCKKEDLHAWIEIKWKFETKNDYWTNVATSCDPDFDQSCNFDGWRDSIYVEGPLADLSSSEQKHRATRLKRIVRALAPEQYACLLRLYESLKLDNLMDKSRQPETSI